MQSYDTLPSIDIPDFISGFMWGMGVVDQDFKVEVEACYSAQSPYTLEENLAIGFIYMRDN